MSRPGGPPPDFNWDAMGQASRLEQENAKLRMALEQREREVDSLRSLAEVAAPMSTGDIIAADVKASRIAELVKQNKAVNLALEREKAKTSKLAADLQKATAAAGKGMMTPGPDADPNSVQALCRQMVQEAGAAAEAAERKAEDLKEKYQQAMTRFDKEVTKSSALKSEAEKLRRALQKECGLGDDAPLQRLLDEASDWRGRAQEISLLKGRVKELRNKLAAAAVETGSVMSDVTEGSTSAFSSHETAVRKNLERLEKDRRGNIAMAEAEVAAARDEVAAMKKKLEGALARKTVVENECRSLKENMQTLIEKTSNDDKLIDALKTELRKKPAATKPAPATATTTGRIGDRASGSAVSLSVPALEALERKTVEQQGQILRQEKIILALQQQVAAAAAAAPAGLHVLEVEKEKLEQLVEVFRERVEQAQAATADAQAQLQDERIKVLQLERQVDGRSAVGSANPDKVSKLENDLLRVSAECHRVQQAAMQSKSQYQEELALYKAMLQRLRTAP